MTRTGPNALTGSEKARKQAAVILEVLSGVRTTAQGSEALSVSLGRYYALETRAVQGLVDALEPRPRGRKPPEVAIEDLRKENERLTRDLGRSMALVRAAQRSLGIQPPPRKTKKKNRRPSRGQRTVQALRRSEGSAPKKRSGGAPPAGASAEAKGSAP